MGTWFTKLKFNGVGNLNITKGDTDINEREPGK